MRESSHRRPLSRVGQLQTAREACRHPRGWPWRPCPRGDPLSLVSRLAAAVPLPRQHAIKYPGVLAAATAKPDEEAGARDPERVSRV